MMNKTKGSNDAALTAPQPEQILDDLPNGWTFIEKCYACYGAGKELAYRYFPENESDHEELCDCNFDMQCACCEFEILPQPTMESCFKCEGSGQLIFQFNSIKEMSDYADHINIDPYAYQTDSNEEIRINNFYDQLKYKLSIAIANAIANAGHALVELIR